MEPKQNIQSYYIELKETPSIILSWEPYILEKLIKFIQYRRSELEEIVFMLSCQTGKAAEAIENKYEYHKNKQKHEFDKLDYLEEICKKAIAEKTKQLQKSKQKYLDGKKLTSPQIALIIYYKFESRYIFRIENQTKLEFIEDQINELGLKNSAKKVEIFFNTFYTSNKRKEEKETKTPLNIKNIEAILPHLENYPIAKNKAENDLISLKN